MHGDQYHRAVLGFMGLVALAQEQGQQNSLINGHGHTKFFFHCRSELHTNGIFLPVVLHHIQNTLIGQPLLCCLSAFQRGGKVQTQTVESGFRVHSVELARGLFEQCIHTIHDAPIHHLIQRFTIDLALGHPAGELLHIVFQFGVDDAADVLFADAALPQLVALAVDDVIDRIAERWVPELWHLLAGIAVFLVHTVRREGIGIALWDQFFQLLAVGLVVQQASLHAAGKIVEVKRQFFLFVCMKGPQVGIGAAQTDIVFELFYVIFAPIQAQAVQQFSVHSYSALHSHSLIDQELLHQRKTLPQLPVLQRLQFDPGGKASRVGILDRSTGFILQGTHQNDISQHSIVILDQIEQMFPAAHRQIFDVIQKQHTSLGLFQCFACTKQAAVCFFLLIVIIVAAESFKGRTHREHLVLASELVHQVAKCSLT